MAKFDQRARADWYKNIQNNPIFEAQVGYRKFKARAVGLSTEGTGEMFVQFHRKKTCLHTFCDGHGWNEIQRRR